MSKLLEDVVLSIAVALGLSIALYLSWALVVGGHQYPPTLIAAFLAIGTAALIYRFMGGLGGAEFTTGLLKLGGSAAFFAGMIWFVGDRLREEVGLTKSTATLRQEADNLQAQLDHMEKTSSGQEDELKRLRAAVRANGCPEAKCTIADVRKLQPNDPFVVGIRRLVEGQERPFVSILRELPVKISVIAGTAGSPSFNICSDTLAKLNEGVEVPSPSARLSRTLNDGSAAAVNARKTGLVGEDACAVQPRDFDVQISCAAALNLFGDRISSCAESSALRGSTISIGSLAE